MQISGLFRTDPVAGLPAASAGRQTVAAATATATGRSGAGSAVQVSDHAASLLQSAGQAEWAGKGRAIMAGHDLRNSTYSELLALADALQAAGLLAEKDYLDFVGPNPELAAINGAGVPATETRQDFLGHHEKQLAFMKQLGAEPRHIAFKQGIVALYRMFHALQGPAT